LYSVIESFLHEDGRYFENMNNKRALGYFYNLFFKNGGTSEKYNLEINNGISLDHLPGEAVVEFRYSTCYPQSELAHLVKKQFGEKPDSRIEELVLRLAFTFCDDKIKTIRIPRKAIGDINRLIINN